MNTQTQMTTAPQAASVGLLNLESFELSQRIAKMLSSSTLVPEQYRATVKVKAGKDNFGNMVFRDEPNPNGLSNCVIALNMANRMGADPLMVMQNLYLIEGRPAWSAQFIMAAINSCGRFSALRFDIQDLGEKEVEYTTTEWVDRKKSTVTKKIKINDMSCVAFAVERETGERIESSKITIEMAVKEGWFTKNGSKWQTMPEQMLRYRSASFFGRVYAPELLMGLRSADEEQDRIIDVTPEADVTSNHVDTKQLKREILAVKSPAALDAIENKVLDIANDQDRNDLLKLVDAQAQKFQPVAEVIVEKKPEPQHEEVPPVEEVKEVEQPKKTRTRTAPKVVEEALAVEAVAEQNPTQISQAVKGEYMVALTGATQLDAIATLENEINKDSRLLDNQRSNLTSYIETRRRVINEALAKETEAQSPAADPIKSLGIKTGLQRNVTEAADLDALKIVAANIREYKPKLTAGHMNEVLADYSARKKFLEDQQDMFAGVEEVSYVDSVIARIQNAKSQDDINAVYADPAFDELSGADRDRIDGEAQQREAELQD